MAVLGQRRLGVPKSPAASARGRRTPASGKGLVFSLEGFLQDELVQRQLGDGPLQAIVLAFEILQTLGLIELQTAVGRFCRNDRAALTLPAGAERRAQDCIARS